MDGGMLGMLVGVSVYVTVCCLPIVMGRVNPIFAAKTIEEAAPGFKNGLINLLLLSERRQTVRPVIFAGLNRQAAVPALVFLEDLLQHLGPRCRNLFHQRPRDWHVNAQHHVW